jgi:hypothetical protein
VSQALAPARPFGLPIGMAKVNTIGKPKEKRIGRPPRPGGRDPVVAVRLPRELLAQVDAWAAEKSVQRSDAIREMVAYAVAGRARRKGKS